MSDLPSVSVVIPTYNSERVLEECLESIKNQNYPKENIEILIIDGGSTDNTIEVAKRYTDKILENPERIAATGKAYGVNVAENGIIALVDSDNILDSSDWLRRMVAPFKDPKIVASEPLYYTYRRGDFYINRYCTLTSCNDPLCIYLGNYDRYNYLTGKWTELPVKETDKGDYLEIELDEKNIPTLGANGFLVRADALKETEYKPLLYDVDVVYDLVTLGYNHFAKVKVGIVHVYTDSTKAFIKKQQRRITEYLEYENMRKYPWNKANKMRIIKFVLSTLFVIPQLVDVIKGYRTVRDRAWLFHIPACWITLIIYALGTIKNLFRVEPEDRSK